MRRNSERVGKVAYGYRLADDRQHVEPDQPTAEVHVLRPERTFWEKATLLHAVFQ